MSHFVLVRYLRRPYTMECRARTRIQCQAALVQAQIGLLDANLAMHRLAQNRARRRRQRRWWVRAWFGPPRRRQFGLYNQLMVELRREDQRSLINFMRMPPEMFDEILVRVGPRITKKRNNYRLPIEPGMKLAIALRHLVSGSKYRDMRFGWRVPHNTIALLVQEVCRAIIDEYVDEVMAVPTTAADWTRIADGFRDNWNFPHTLGAIDGKHIACKCPPRSGSTYFNYKKYFSVVLLALVDFDYRFIWADIGGRGAASDAQVWNESDLKAAAENGDLNLPEPEALPHDTEDVPYFFIGDEAFGLRTYMQKPYSHRALSKDERIFNYRLSRARRVVENAFGILANRFQVLMSTMQHRPSNIRLIVTTCLVLHNLMRIRYPRVQNRLLDRDDRNQHLIPGEWRRGRQMHDCRVVQGPNRDNREGKKLRNLLKHWVNSPAGSVPWQDNMI